MNINKLAKIMSDFNKSKIITHFYSCKCQMCDVSKICSLLNIEQSNMSKHLFSLRKMFVIDFKKIGKNSFYYINKEFKKEWETILNPIINHKELKFYKCKCSI